MNKKQALAALIVAIIVASSSLIVQVRSEDATQPRGVISLTFDDGWQNQYTNAFPLLQNRGMAATFYVITSCLVNNLTSSMSFAELQTMQAAGCEIGSHSVTHPDFTTLTESQIEEECVDSKTTLQSYGLTVNNFAYPFGAYNGYTDSIVSQYYRTARNVWCGGYVLPLPYIQFDLAANEGDIGDQAAQALGFTSLLPYLESIVDTAVSTNEWAVIYFHQILPNVDNDPCVTNNQTLASFLDYVKSKGVPTLTVDEALNLNSPPSPPPTVTIDPSSVSMDVGQSATFSSSLSGGNPAFSYQWCLNGQAVPGAINRNWTFTPSSTGDFTVYLNVTDAIGYQVQSNAATEVTYPRPTVSINPSTANMTTGTSQTFISNVLGGDPPYNYQWYLNDTAISGATNADYTFTPTSAGIYDIYMNLADNAGITVNSSSSTINVETPTNVTVTPTHVGICLGQSQSFTSTASGGTTPYGYQWFLNDSAVSGATDPTWVFTPPSTGNFEVYLNVTNGFNLMVQSNIVTDITVYPQLTVSINPASVNMTIRTNQQINSTVAGGLSPYTYQWYYANGTAISGATTSNLAYSANSIGAFSIYLNVTDSLNDRTQSNIATINVYSQPTVIITPTSANMIVNTNRQFTSTVAGGLSPYTYQWYLNGSQVPGANQSNWMFNPTAAGTYIIYLGITDNLTAVAYSGNSIAKVETPPSVAISPTQVKIDLGESFVFSSSVSGGTSPYVYQWYLNDSAVHGANSLSWTFTPLSVGNYRVYLNVTDAFNFKVQSNTVTDVTVYPKLMVSAGPSSVDMVVGTPQTFSSIVSGGAAPFYYQWYMNGTLVSGAASSNWTFNPTEAGTYVIYVTAADNYTSVARSDNAVANVETTMNVTVTPTQRDMNINQTQIFVSAISGGTPPYTYQWFYANGTPIPGATNSNLTYTANSTGTYGIFVKATDDLNFEHQSNTVTINVTPSPTPTPTAIPTITPTPTAQPASTPTTTQTPVQTVAPTPPPSVAPTPASSETPAKSPQTTPTSATQNIVIGTAAVIAACIIATLMLMKHKHLKAK